MHAEPEAMLQPSLHTLEEYRELVFAEAEDRGVDVRPWREIASCEGSMEWASWDIDDVLQKIQDAGYPVIEQDDTLLIYPKGSEVPEEWLS